MQKEEFAKRLNELRLAKEVSAQKMSLAIGQSKGYIKTIECNRAFPSMKAFFNICDYLGITPEQFFNLEVKNPLEINELKRSAAGLSSKQPDALISLLQS